MKSFFKIIFATFFALVLFTVLLAVVFIGATIGLARMGAKQEPKIEKGSYLVIDMSMNIPDTPPPSEGEQALRQLFGGGDAQTASLRQTIEAVNQAAKDDRITGIFLQGSFVPANYGSGFAALKEVREALTAFKESKKGITAYLVSPTTRDYYLASVADTIYMNPFGEMQMPGLHSEPMFFADAFKKYGIGVQVTRVGKYKSFVEPFILDKMSPENREQTQMLLDDVWSQFKDGVEHSRNIPAAQLQALVDKDGIINPADAKQNGLINDVAYLPDVIEKLRQNGTETTKSGTSTFKQVDLQTYINQNGTKTESADNALANLIDTTPKVAVVYAEGDIVDGDGDAANSIGGDRFARELRRLREDKTVRAIVLRVNSPGGSALASEVIQHEMILARGAGKPIIVSMGTVAASGGYWISTASDRIFAEPNTITGSIGVFGILPNIQQLANDHGVTFDGVKTGKFADLETASRPKSPEELQVIQTFVDHIYDEFIKRVAAARNLPEDKVKEIAQGRVWSGEQALKIGLVDEIGGLDAALAYAKTKSKLPVDAKVVEYPAPVKFAEQLADFLNGQKRPVASIFGVSAKKAGVLGREVNRFSADLEALNRLNDPMNTYVRLPFDVHLD